MRNLFKPAVLILIALFPALVSAALQNGKVEVGLVKGTATLIDPKAAKKALASGLVFQEGYTVETNLESTTELILSNGSTLIVSPNTLLEIRTFKQVASSLIIEGSYQKLDKEPSPSVTEIEVKRGKVLGEVRKLNPMSSYTIKTPVGVARIRGTIYEVGYEEDKKGMATMSVGCVRGSVEATVFASSSGPVSVAPGQQVTVVAPAPPKPAAEEKPAAAPAPAAGTAAPAAGAPAAAPAAGAPAPTASEPAPPAPPATPVSITTSAMDSRTLSSIAQTLATSTSLPPTFAQEVSAQATLAPPPVEAKPATDGAAKPAADGTAKPAAESTEKPAESSQATSSTAPTAPMSTSTGGGGGSAIDQLVQKITDTVQQNVEKAVQTNPSGTGG
ncbi:MAG: FecR domain-containing protein [Verrucomicrobia bacterium]|nr:FecR domain-containing protein [Verrucomicrobiota bacterium]